MTTKKDSASKADKKETKRTTTKKTPAKKTTKPKAPEKKVAPEKPPEDITFANAEEKIKAPEAPKPPAIIDDTDKILKSSDVKLPPEEKPTSKPTIVVSHDKASRADDSIEVISAEEVLKDMEYDFDTHEIKPFKGEAMTSHDMHQGKYGIIEDVTKEKKKK